MVSASIFLLRQAASPLNREMSRASQFIPGPTRLPGSPSPDCARGRHLQAERCRLARNVRLSTRKSRFPSRAPEGRSPAKATRDQAILSAEIRAPQLLEEDAGV
jgi:hypothetical protein